MPRSGGGTYTLPAGSIVTDGVDDILATQHNTPLQDLALDANTARPVVVGGTGATTLSGARSNLRLPAQFEDYGALGDGVANDAPALQLALNSGLPLVMGKPGAIYKCNAAVTIPSNITIDLNGARIRRGFVGGPFVLRSANSYTTWDNVEIHLKNIWIDDDGTTATRGGGLNLAGDRITLDGYRYSCTAPYDGVNGCNAIYVTGKDITFRRIRIDSRTQGTFADGVHAAYIENFTMTDFHIQTQDDAIALHPDTATFAWTGKNLPSNNIDIQGGYVSSEDANGIRIGAWGVATFGTITPKPNVVFQNVNVDMTIGQCGTSCIELVDTRNSSEITGALKHTDITIKARVRYQADAVRIIHVQGSPDITNAANLARRNYGRVAIEVHGASEEVSGNNIARVGGVDYIEITGSLRYFDGTSPTLTNMIFSSAGTVVLDGLTTQGRTSGSFCTFKWVENVVISDIDHIPDATAEFQSFVLIQTPEVPMSFYLRGGRISETARALNITGTGILKDFVVEGTTLGSSITAFPVAATFTNTTWDVGGRVVFNPSGGYLTSFANLMGAGVPVVDGHIAHVTNGRKAAEGAGLGTGQSVYRDGTAWLRLRDDAAVTA